LQASLAKVTAGEVHGERSGDGSSARLVDVIDIAQIGLGQTPVGVGSPTPALVAETARAGAGLAVLVLQLAGGAVTAMATFAHRMLLVTELVNVTVAGRGKPATTSAETPRACGN
jgi:hypothetical protein